MCAKYWETVDGEDKMNHAEMNTLWALLENSFAK